MLKHLTAQEYYGQNACLEPEALLELLRAITARRDYPPQPRFRNLSENTLGESGEGAQ